MKDAKTLYLNSAREWAAQSTCLRRMFGCVIVNRETEEIISGSYNGSPRGMPHCQTCMRDELNIPSGSSYDMCLVGSTIVKLLDGTYKTIEELSIDKSDVWVYSIDVNTMKIVPALGTNPRLTGYTNELIKVKFSKSGSITVTPDHKILMRDGTYKCAKDLKYNDRVVPIYYTKNPNTSKGKLYERVNNGIRYIIDGSNTKIPYEHTKTTLTHNLVFKYFNPNSKIDYNTFIHHIDENSLNNTPNNLELINRSEHSKNHSTLSHIPEHIAKEFRKRGLETHLYNIKHDPIKKKNHSENSRTNMCKNWSDPNFVKRHMERAKVSGAKTAAMTNSDPEIIRKRLRGRIIIAIYELGVKSGIEITVDNYETIAKQYPVASKLKEKGCNPVKIKTILKWFDSLQEAIDLANKINHKVERIDYIECDNIPVYCMTVKSTGNFAIDLGDNSCVIVHNCNSVHSESNALIKAGMRAYGCDLYLHGFDVKLNVEINPRPCFWCTKLMINSKINKVITQHAIFDPIELYLEYEQNMRKGIVKATFDP